jgi:predicted secreted hydrolase
MVFHLQRGLESTGGLFALDRRHRDAGSAAGHPADFLTTAGNASSGSLNMQAKGSKISDYGPIGRESMEKEKNGGGLRGQTRRTAGSLRHWVIVGWLCLSAASMAGFEAAAQQSEEGYRLVTGPCRLKFPADHGAHPGFRTEWWYYTGNLQTAQQRSFGFQLTVFRRRIRPPETRQAWPEPASRWRTRQIYLGHVAVTDITGGRHLFSESIARGALDLAGVRQSKDHTTVLLDKWSIDIRPGRHRLQVAATDVSLDLRLQPVKPPVLHGDLGYSRKGDSAERASCYYSFTRLRTAGTIRLGEEVFALSGNSWMDHEYSTASLQPGISGWDWFSLQLDNGADVMIYLLRRQDGTRHPASSGTLVDAGGRSIHLTASDFTVDVLDYWTSPHSKATYPSGWTVRVNDRAIDLTVSASLADQEMRTGASTGVTYWEGSVFASGTAGGRVVEGKGYVELTGYAGKMEALK